MSDNKGNFALSRLSLFTLFIMLLEGASGETEKILETYLEDFDFQVNQEEKLKFYRSPGKFRDFLYDLLVKNKILNSNLFYVDKRINLKNEYVKRIQVKLAATVKQLDFESGSEALNTIKHDVQQVTKNRHTQLLDSLDFDVAMILINVIHFRSLYDLKLNKWNCREFTQSDGTVRWVPMMFRHSVFGYVMERDFVAVELCYPTNISMIIILPNENISLKNISNLLIDHKEFKRFVEPRLSYSRRVFLTMPKFKIETFHFINSSFIEKKIFKEMTPDLSKISDQPLNKLKVIQHVVIEVNEAMLDDAVARVPSEVVDSVNLTIDKPFGFIVLAQHSSACLFSGYVEDPTRRPTQIQYYA